MHSASEALLHIAEEEVASLNGEGSKLFDVPLVSFKNLVDCYIVNSFGWDFANDVQTIEQVNEFSLGVAPLVYNGTYVLFPFKFAEILEPVVELERCDI